MTMTQDTETALAAIKELDGLADGLDARRAAVGRTRLLMQPQ